jgi:hypothetical protein
MPDVWEYREPAEHGHPQTQAAAAAPQAYSQDEYLRRLRGPQVDAPRQQPLGPHLPGYEQTGQLYAPPPQYTPPRNVSWVSAHKGLTAVLSVCVLTVTGAGVFALLPSGPGSPGPSAAAIAGVTASSRAPVQQAGVTAGAAPAAGITVTGTATAGAAVKGHRSSPGNRAVCESRALRAPDGNRERRRAGRNREHSGGERHDPAHNPH